MNKEFVEETVGITLEDLHSFLKAGQTLAGGKNEFDKYKGILSSIVSVDPDESIFGIYINSLGPLNCLVITDKGIHKFDSAKDNLISYDSIDSINPPGDEDQDLDIALTTGDWVALPVLGVTEETRDITAMYQFLTFLLEQPNKFAPDLTEIESLSDLTTYLRQITDDEQIGGSLPKELQEWIEESNIDPLILEQRGIWRLCAHMWLVGYAYSDREQ